MMVPPLRTATSPVRSERLDQILLRQQKITEDQLRAALDRQGRFGGKLGEQLIQLGAIEEMDLAEALSEHFGVPGIALRDVEVPAKAIAALPAEIAGRYDVAPCGFNEKRKTVSVAFADPNDPSAVAAVTEAVAPLRLQVMVGAATAVHELMRRCYDTVDATADDGDRPEEDKPANLLVVAADAEIGQSLASLLTGDGRKAVLATTRAEALDRMARERFARVYLQSGHELAESEARTALGHRDITRGTRLVIWDDLDSLLLGGPKPYDVLMRAFRETVGMLVSVHETGTPQRMGRSWWTANLAGETARRMGLPTVDCDELRLAALLADIGMFGEETAGRRGDGLARAAEALRPLAPAFDVPAILTGIQSLTQPDSQSDATVNRKPPTDRRVLILHAARAVADRYEPMGGRGFTAVEAVIDWLDEAEELDATVAEATAQAIRELDLRGRLRALAPEILLASADRDNGPAYGISAVLFATGKRLLHSQGLEACLVAVRRRPPDVVVALLSGNLEHDLKFVRRLGEALGPTATPLVVVAGEGYPETIPGTNATEMSAIRAEAGMQAIVAQIDRYLQGREGLPDDPGQGGVDAHAGETRGITGSLKDFSLVDLVQALAAGRKTVRVTLTSGAHHGSIDIDGGHVVHADVEGRDGGDAFYEMLGWDDGQFAVTPVEGAAFRTITAPLDALLLEGCRLIDESQRVKTTVDTTARQERS